MSKYTNNKILTSGYKVNSQSPIDDRLVFTDLTDLQNLGTSSEKPYTYYEGLRVWVLSTEKEYIWKESASGVLTTSFTYPTGVSNNGVSYSNRSFNWVEVNGSGSGPSLQVDLIDLTATTPYVIDITGAAGIIDVEVYFNNVKITNGVNILVSSDQVTLESNINMINVTVKTTF